MPRYVYKGKTMRQKERIAEAIRDAGNYSRNQLVAARRFTRAPNGGPRGFYGPANRPRGLRPELKTIDLTGGLINFTTAGVLTLLNGVTDGVGNNVRIGTKIWLKSMLLRLSTFPNIGGTGDPTGEMLRVMVIYDKQANGVAPTVANILNTGAWDSPNNLAFRDRFTTLLDKTIDVQANAYAGNTIVGGSVSARHIMKFKPLALPVVFNGTGATIASISTGSIYLLCMSAFGQDQGFYFNSRIRFVDP